jgi:hypothetical protein
MADTSEECQCLEHRSDRADLGEWIRSSERVVVKTFADLLLQQAHFSKRVERGGGYRARAMAMAGTWQEPEHLNAQI